MIDKAFLKNACDGIFLTKRGRDIENTISEFMSSNSMNELLARGVAVGFSGGADSVLLLIFLRKIQKELGFTLKAVHINHMIRGADADEDEAFSKEFAEALGIEFISKKIDVPSIAKSSKTGLEEAARNVRYQFLNEIVDSTHAIGAIATAHNATDNLETVIFNLMRGTGINGLCGIAPVRDNIIRPMLQIPKAEILELLNEAKIPFTTDKTNFSCDYSRNYIRHEILPKLKNLSNDPEAAVARAIKNLKSDSDYIDVSASKIFSENCKNGKISKDILASAHPSVFARIVSLMALNVSEKKPETYHIDTVRALIAKEKDFKFDFPGEITFISNRNFCTIKKREKNQQAPDFEEIVLSDGFNEIPNRNIVIHISDKKDENSYSNIYNFSIQANISSAIINGRLRLRGRKAGDSYYYGGMTRKLKKLFIDKKLTEEEKKNAVIISDDDGIVWVNGFGVRDDSPKERKDKWITIYEKKQF